MACRCWNGNEMNGRWGVSACLIEIQWQKWPKLSEGLLQIAASEALPRFVSVLFFFFLFTVFECLFFPFPPSLPIFFFSIYPSLLLPRHWNGFWNEISQITIFQTAAMCFLHMRCYRSNRAIIHPPAVWYRLRCINLAWHVRPGISFMLSVPVLVDWCNCKLVCRWISLVLLLLLLFFLFDGGQWRGVSECPGGWLTVCHVQILPVIQIRFLQIPFWKLNPHSH